MGYRIVVAYDPSVRVRRGHLPRRPGLSHVALLVVSTGARSAERRDLFSAGEIIDVERRPLGYARGDGGGRS